jgi:hypothetical protein
VPSGMPWALVASSKALAMSTRSERSSGERSSITVAGSLLSSIARMRAPQARLSRLPRSKSAATLIRPLSAPSLIVHSDSQGGWPDASACASTEQCRDRPDRSSRPDLRQASVGRRLGATATATCRRSARPAPPTMAFAPAWRVAVPVGGKSDLAPQRRDGRSGMIWA